jgi:Alw26I/Eco31I/Esp3I family type II restriction endonuclease
MYDLSEVNAAIVINEDPTNYGSKGQTWADEFVKYMKAIVTHPVYKGMPDSIKEDGRIQWETPSNRSGGKYQDSHQKRRHWWQLKAKQIGIDRESDQWISRTAKTIHPTGEKPCKRCGTILQIAYVYPNAILIKKIKKAFGLDFDVSPLEPISEIIQKAVDTHGLDALTHFKKMLSITSTKVPDFDTDMDAFLLWIDQVYVPSEPSLLSPGVMSNAPDRFDGFHSFNKCCRGIADSGRSESNLKSYTTDRRVFEYWSEGDWVSADRLMGLVRAQFRNEPCADGGDIPPSADHIGPLSLGFCHRPEFRLLSKSANSAKNNRMTLRDIKDLIAAEEQGIQVVSWYAKYLWDDRKNHIDTEGKALRLSKLLRDNQRNTMMLLSSLFENKAYFFLIYLMELHHADKKIAFENLRIEHFITRFDKLLISTKTTAYALEQKSRRLRIGFESLRSYKESENRHLLLVDEDFINEQARKITTYLNSSIKDFTAFNEEIEAVLLPTNGVITEINIQNLITKLPNEDLEAFKIAKQILIQTMTVIGAKLLSLWETDRYMR